jgi:hypothetical protein
MMLGLSDSPLCNVPPFFWTFAFIEKERKKKRAENFPPFFQIINGE